MSLNEISTKIKEFLLPKYTEITLFLTSLIVFLLFATVAEFREGVFDFFIEPGEPMMWLVLFFIILGFASSIYYSFIENKISDYFKNCMLFYVVLVNIAVGFSAGFYLLKEVSGFNMIFPLINLLNALFLLIIMRNDILNESAILDIHAKRSEILVGSIAVIIIFIYSHFVLNNYWAITFSVCLAYATTVNEIINKILFRNKTSIN